MLTYIVLGGSLVINVLLLWVWLKAERSCLYAWQVTHQVMRTRGLFPPVREAEPMKEYRS